MEPLPNDLVLAFGRPTWREYRQVGEARALRSDPPRPPDGSGRTVLIVPGYGGSDASMGALAEWLDRGGFSVGIAPLERNIRSSAWAADRVTDALAGFDIAPVLIGHSRGGQAARVAAVRRPDLVDQLITLGAPVRHHTPRHALLRPSFELLRAAAFLRLYAEWQPAEERRFEVDLTAPFPDSVRWTSIWSRSDGFVDPAACLDPAAANVEVDCSHRGLVESVAAFEALGEVLRRG